MEKNWFSHKQKNLIIAMLVATVGIFFSASLLFKTDLEPKFGKAFGVGGGVSAGVAAWVQYCSDAYWSLAYASLGLQNIAGFEDQLDSSIVNNAMDVYHQTRDNYYNAGCNNLDL